MISISAADEKAKRIALQAHNMLATQQALRTTTSEIQVEAADGVLALKGRVRTNSHRNLAQRLAQTAINGWQLRNELISDEALALEIAQRLAADPRTAAAQVRCDVFLGVVTLQGTVKGPWQHQAVLEVVGKVPGVASVNDQLNVVS